MSSNNSLITASEQILLFLLSNELFAYPLLDTSSVDWAEVYELGRRHAVVPLLYPAMKHIATVPKEVFSNVRKSAFYSTELSERMLRSHQEIVRLLESRQIPCAILKGMSVARFYPHPALRQPGDIDLLVDFENLQDACAAMESAGYEFSHNTDKHYCYHKGDVSVEIHHMVSEFPNTEKGDFAGAYMSTALNDTQQVKMNGVTFPALSGAHQLISLLAHMEHHLASTGIGLRQFCDWAITVNALCDQIGSAELAILDQCGLLEFAKVSTKLCEKYLGLPPFDWSASASDELVDALMCDLLESGNFHAQAEVRPFVSTMTDAYNTDDRNNHSVIHSYFKYIRGRIHTEQPQMKSPLWVAVFAVFYPVRWTIRMLLGKRKKFDLKQSIQSAKKREEMLQGLKLYK